MRIELTPLSSPVGADYFLPNDLAALRSLGPAHIISANAPSMSRLLNAEYACSMMVLVSAIHPPRTPAMPSIIVMRPVHIIADELQQKEGRSGTVFILLLPFDR